MDLYNFLRAVQKLGIVDHISAVPSVQIELMTIHPIYFILFINTKRVGPLNFDGNGQVVGLRPDPLAPYSYVEAVKLLIDGGI